MNIKELAILFVVGGVEGSAGRYSIKIHNPNFSTLIFKQGVHELYMGVRVKDATGKLHLLMNMEIPCDVSFGDYHYGPKSQDIQRSINNVITGLRNTAVERSYDRIDAMNVTYMIEAYFGKEVANFTNTFAVEQQRLLADLQYRVGTQHLLKNEDGSLIAANPICQCEACRKFFSPTRVAMRQTTKIENEEIVEDDVGAPVLIQARLCEICRGSEGGINISEDQMHAIVPPVFKSQTTFTKWPFTRTAGVELETLLVAPIDQMKLRGLGWRMVHDGSIKAGGKPWRPIEFNSPASAGDAFFDRITQGMKLWAGRARVNDSCGFHVHIDWTDLDAQQKANCFNFLVAMEHLMFECQPPTRRGNNYCRKYGADFPYATPNKIPSSEKYMGINFSHANTPSVFGATRDGAYGTVEFRMGAGTRNVEKVLKWAEFCQRLIEIGAEFSFDDDCKALRSKNIEAKLSLFEEMSKKCDEIYKRPPEYLNLLMTWIKARIEKFSKVKVSTRTIKVDYKAKQQTFEASRPVEVVPVSEKYEEHLGIA